MYGRKCEPLHARNPYVEDFQKRLIDWYREEGRSFYWRTHVLNGWQWLVLEILLRKTRADAVEKAYPSFISKYSKPEIVLKVPDAELENDLRILGLYRQRREVLKLIAAEIDSQYGGVTPSDQKSLSALPGVGPYISNAVLCFCYNQRRPVVDINVARVLTRFQCMDTPKDATKKWLWELAENMLPEENWKEYNYGLLDLGALLCISKQPKCILCSLRDICEMGRERASIDAESH